MVKHIVLFRLTTFSDNEEKRAQMEELKEIFSSLPEKLPYLKDYRTGCNITGADHAWDFAIDSVFCDIEELREYQQSSEHLEAVRKASRIGKVKAMVDYEF